MPDRISFTQPINDSAQIGDRLLYIYANVATGSIMPGSTPTDIGTIVNIGKWTYIDPSTLDETDYFFVDAATSSTPPINPPTPPGITIAPHEPIWMFRKHNSINVSTLVGYFGEVKMTLGNDGKSELFSIGSEIFVSSK